MISPSRKISGIRLLVALVVSAFILSSCSSMVRKGVYSAYEKFGVYKRDLLKKQIVETEDDFKGAEKSAKDALTRLREAYPFKTSKLDKIESDLKSRHEKIQKQADEIDGSIEKMNTVARDLFQEWKKEAHEISDARMKRESLAQLKETQSKYSDLEKKLSNSARSLDPFLRKLNDYVLFFKHQLNAQALGALEAEGLRIQLEIETLLRELSSSISEAEEFLKELK